MSQRHPPYYSEAHRRQAYYYPPPQTRLCTHTSGYVNLLIIVLLADHRMNLNNLLPRIGGHLTYQEWQVGPLDQTTWHAIAYSECLRIVQLLDVPLLSIVILVNNVEYGRGFGTTLGAAREEAARRTLRAIYHDRAIEIIYNR
jgi:hypothetical protein